jgi:predicted secreted protein
MKNTVLAGLVLLLAGGVPALAADGAQSRAIGYSADGKYFAFEQYGIQDGSGFPYWDIFVLDLAANAWVEGTPARALVENEEARLSEARVKAHAAADAILMQLNIVEPADLLVANPQTEAVPDRRAARFDAYYGYRSDDSRGQFEIRVADLELPSPAECTDPDFKPVGMVFSVTDHKTGQTRELARDGSIPKSRNCPTGYDIEAVFAPSNYGNSGRHVAIVGVYSRGFEGEDRRFIAVPFDLSE